MRQMVMVGFLQAQNCTNLVSSWRHPDSRNDSMSADYYQTIGRVLEEGKFHVGFFDDRLAMPDRYGNDHRHTVEHGIRCVKMDPVTVLTVMGMATKRLGLGATRSTTYYEPFDVARTFATLDLMTEGRAAWNVVTSPLEGSARNFSRTEHPEHDERYRIADEYLAVTKGLWDSWEEDAFVRDRASGVFFDPAKLHPLNHKGKYFSVEGPLNVGRTPQARPILFQAGASEAGKQLAARHADAVFTHHDTLAQAREFYADLKRQVIGQGRHPDDLKIFQGIGVIVGISAEEAERQYQESLELITIDSALDHLGRFFEHHDFGRYPLDEPFPEIGDLGSNSFRSGTDEIKRNARERGLTLRQVALESAAPRPRFIGTPERIADGLQEWFEADAADGFIVGGGTPAAFTDFVEQVVPILRERGLFRAEYQGTTLRDHLGVGYPPNRYAAA